jgi:hypothetical protein
MSTEFSDRTVLLSFEFFRKIQHLRTQIPNPLKKGALEVPPFLRGARGDLGFRLQCVSPKIL